MKNCNVAVPLLIGCVILLALSLAGCGVAAQPVAAGDTITTPVVHRPASQPADSGGAAVDVTDLKQQMSGMLNAALGQLKMQLQTEMKADLDARLEAKIAGLDLSKNNHQAATGTTAGPDSPINTFIFSGSGAPIVLCAFLLVAGLYIYQRRKTSLAEAGLTKLMSTVEPRGVDSFRDAVKHTNLARVATKCWATSWQTPRAKIGQ